MTRSSRCIRPPTINSQTVSDPCQACGNHWSQATPSSGLADQPHPIRCSIQSYFCVNQLANRGR